MKYIVVDLDGTLCDCRHRQHLAQAKEWDAFNALCHEDAPWADVQEFVQLMSSNNSCLSDEEQPRVLVVSARSEKYRGATRDWLKEHQIPIFDLLMRPEFDFSDSVKLKIQLLEDYFGGKDQVLDKVLFCLDDRDKVIEGLRNYGLSVFQVRPGGY